MTDFIKFTRKDVQEINRQVIAKGAATFEQSDIRQKILSETHFSRKEIKQAFVTARQRLANGTA